MEERYADPRRRGGRGGRCRERRATTGRARARAWTRRGRTSSGRQSPCADVLRERRGDRESALRDGRATKARGRVFDRRACDSRREGNGWRSRGGPDARRRPISRGRVEAARARVPRIIRARSKRLRGRDPSARLARDAVCDARVASLAQWSVRRSSRVCRFSAKSLDPFGDARCRPREGTWALGIDFYVRRDDVSESRFVNRQTGPSLRPKLGIGSGNESTRRCGMRFGRRAARETKISKIFLKCPPVIGQERRDFRFSLVQIASRSAKTARLPRAFLHVHCKRAPRPHLDEPPILVSLPRVPIRLLPEPSPGARRS